MLRFLALTAAAGVAVITLSQGVYSQPNPYQTIENHFKLPEGRKIGSTVGITIDRDGSSVWVFDRCDQRSGRRFRIEAPGRSGSVLRTRIDRWRYKGFAMPRN